MIAWTCTTCARPLRGSNTPKSRAPGTVVHRGHGFCGRCLAAAGGSETVASKIPPMPGDWVYDAVCATTHPDVFFPEIKTRDAVEAALKMCGTCPALEMCRAYAIKHRPKHGIWGGLTTEDRRIKKRQRA